MVALATFALQSAKKLFQKAIWKTKYAAWYLLYLDQMFADEELVLIPLSESTFAKIQRWTDPCLWGSPA